MRASEQLLERAAVLAAGILPSLTEIDRAVGRVQAKWPDVVAIPDMTERKALAREMLRRVLRWEWASVTIQHVTAAAFAAFDDERRAKPELEPLRAFYLREIQDTDQETFLSALFRVYLDTFAPDAPHTRHLATALGKRRGGLGAAARQLLENLPDLLSPGRAVAAAAKLMAEAADPYGALKQVGFPTPHTPGLLHYAHLAFVDRVAPQLDRADEQERLFRWLKPERMQALQAGASEAIAALLSHWRGRTPLDEMLSRLTEAIVASYGDPRIERGGIWAGFPPEGKAVLFRWLTKEDMRSFCDVITATQCSHHWPPRRDFWLQLFEEGRIDEACVAFGGSASYYAERRLAVKPATDVDNRFARKANRFARQTDRGGSTSLLIMRIRNKIVVDGCHSYRTHIFDANHADAPKLYQQEYFCDQIMHKSRLSKAHNSIPNWRLWLEQHI